MSENEENGIIIDGVDVSGCDYISTDNFSSVCKLLNCDCGSFKGKNCYYKQLQREKQRNEKTEKTLKEIEEIAKNLYNNGNQPPCIGESDCPYNGGVGFDNHCDENCHMILGKKISEKIKEVENDN